MTKEQALALKIGQQTVFKYDPNSEKVVVSGVVEGVFLKDDDTVQVYLDSEHYGHSHHANSDLHLTESDAWQVCSDQLQAKADGFLNRKYWVDAKIKKLREKE